MPAYIDASALAPLILPEPKTAWAQNTILGYAEGRVVSDFAAAEVISAVSRRVRMESFTALAAEQVLARFEAWVASDTVTMTTAGSDILEAGRLVRRFELGLRTPGCAPSWPGDAALSF